MYVIYSDEYDKTYISPSIMNSSELEEAVLNEHKLTKQEINKFSEEWKNLVIINTDMRVLDNGVLKSVSYSFYDNLILNKLKILGQVKEFQLVALLIGEVYLIDSLYFYLIDRLIKENKIKIVEHNPNKILSLY